MTDALERLVTSPQFLAEYAQLKLVRLSDGRHSAANAYEHSELVRRRAVELARLNRRSEQDAVLLNALGMAHDVGKTQDRARHAEVSIAIVQKYGDLDTGFLALIRHHDIALSWHKSHRKGETPGDKAWRRLASVLDLSILCIFMVADRVDSRGGWRTNEPTTWFIGEALRRGRVLNDMIFDVGEDSQRTGGSDTEGPLWN